MSPSKVLIPLTVGEVIQQSCFIRASCYRVLIPLTVGEVIQPQLPTTLTSLPCLNPLNSRGSDSTADIKKFKSTHLNPLNSRGSDSTGTRCVTGAQRAVLIPLTVGEVIQRSI